jgi:hypothetical protein
MRLNYLPLLFFITLFSCSTNPYDTSTPEKLVASLGIVGQQPEDHNPLPYFYDDESAEAIFAFDEAAENGLESFNKFRNSVSAKFPTFVKSNREGTLKITLNGFNGMKTRNFNYSAQMIAAQMKARKPSDYEFVSASEANEEGITELKVKIKGRVSSIPLKKNSDGYHMFSSPEQLDNLRSSVTKIKEFDAVFKEGIQLVESGELTPKNFEEKMALLSEKYFKAVRK